MDTLFILILIIIFILSTVWYWSRNQKSRKASNDELKERIERIKSELDRDDLTHEERCILTEELNQAATEYLKAIDARLDSLNEELMQQNKEKLDQLNRQMRDQK